MSLTSTAEKGTDIRVAITLRTKSAPEISGF